MSSSDQTQTIQNMINQHHSGDSVDLTYMSVKAYCFVHNSNNAIDGVYSG